jgi:hypothetical protein
MGRWTRAMRRLASEIFRTIFLILQMQQRRERDLAGGFRTARRFDPLIKIQFVISYRLYLHLPNLRVEHTWAQRRR